MTERRSYYPPRQTTFWEIPQTESQYEIRILQTFEELLDSYRLRYEIYGAIGYLQSANAARCEIDAYDARSIPLGAFDLVSGAMVGTLRLITDEVQPGYAYLIARVLEQLGDDALTAQANAPATSFLPSIVSDEVEREIEHFNVEGFPIRELSRSIVRPEHRGSGVSRGLMALGMALAARHTPALLIGGCMPEHLPMYARYGYQQLPHTGLDRFGSVGQLAHALVCRTDVVPHPTREQIDELVLALAQGADEHELDLGHGTRAVVSFSEPRQARRRTMEW